jgi:hypothetical protein
MSKYMRAIMLLFACFFFAQGCTGKAPESTPGKKLTRRQRDSVLAESPLPGAAAVGKAISFSDSTTARAKRIDSMAK